MNEQEMKTAWESLSQRVTRLERIMNTDCERASMPNASTALAKLADRYKRFVMMSLGMTVASVCYLQADIIPGHARLPICIMMMVYFLVCAAMDYNLYRRIRAIDVTAMSVAEVSREAQACRKTHMKYVAILVPCAVVIIGAFVWAFSAEADAVYYIIGGAIVGLAIGTIMLRRFLRNYKELNES